MRQNKLKNNPINRVYKSKDIDLILKSYSKPHDIIIEDDFINNNNIDLFRKTQFKLKRVANVSPNNQMLNMNITASVFPKKKLFQIQKVRQSSIIKKRKRNSFKQKATHIQKSPYLTKQSEVQKMLRLLVPVHGPNQSVKLQIKKHNEQNMKNAQLLILKKSECFQDRMCAYNLRMSLPIQTKIFKMNSQDNHIRQALLLRGWKQSNDASSVLFHLKWVYKDKPIDYIALQQGQYYNHFKNNQELTNKNYLRKNINKAAVQNRPNFPYSFDLDYINDQIDFQIYVSQFKLIKMFLILRDQLKKIKINYFQKTLKNKYYFYQYENTLKKQKIIDIQTLLYNKDSQINGQQNELLQKIFQIICICTSIIQKQKTIKYSIFKKKNINKQKLQIFIQLFLKKHNFNIFNKFTNLYICQIFKIGYHLQQLYKNSYGLENIWIIKPTGISRGLGITITNDISKINASRFGKIVQKYIQNPYKLKCGRKFDLRQWVLVKSFQPLKVYIYRYCYARFSSQLYSNDNFDNLSKHLTNYTRNKSSFSKHQDSQKQIYSAMSQIQLSKNIESWNQVRQQINVQIFKTLQCCKHQIIQMQSCFQVYGFDILLDSNLKPYILQVNLSPACQKRQFLNKYLQQMSNGIIDVLQGKQPFNWIQINSNLLSSYQNQKQIIKVKHKKALLIQKWWKKVLKSKQNIIKFQ